VTARALDRGGSTLLVAVAVVIAGTSVLALRPFLAASAPTRTALFAVASIAILLASVALPCSEERRIVARPLLAGIAAVVASSAIVGPAVPLPRSVGALPLSLLAAVAEEGLFRRAAYSTLARAGAPVAVIASATLFALVHVPAYGVAALPVDLGAGLLFGWQRWASGTWGVPAATHAVANLVAVLR
jgi:membrane protease YdiL (CAAX protease family)